MTKLVLSLLSLFLLSLTVEAQQSTAPESGADVLRQFDDATDALVAKVLPAVVQIDVSGYGAPEDNKRSDAGVISRQRAIGSGVVVEPDGYIMTNAHVVAGAQRIRVTIRPTFMELIVGGTSLMRRQRVYDAKLIGSNQTVDLALLKIDEKGLPFIPLKEQYAVRLGQIVLAVGSPEGLGHTVTRGSVSAVGRQVDPDRPMVYIQTDAPINPGNGGGALVDRDGNMIGLNTFILSEGGGSEGLGFAIPKPVVRYVYQEFKEHGRLRRVTIGANAQNIAADLAVGLKLARDWGVVISDVLPGGPADKAGLKPKDVIVTVDNRVIDSLPKFSAFLYLHRRGQPMEMEVLRGGETVKLSITAVETPEGIESLADLIDPQTSLVAPIGVFALDLTPKIAENLPGLRSEDGVLVVARTDHEPKLFADLAAGDVIRAINGNRLASVDRLRSDLSRYKLGEPIVLEVERQGVFKFVAFEME
jgi:serine protease Do